MKRERLIDVELLFATKSGLRPKNYFKDMGSEMAKHGIKAITLFVLVGLTGRTDAAVIVNSVSVVSSVSTPAHSEIFMADEFSHNYVQATAITRGGIIPITPDVFTGASTNAQFDGVGKFIIDLTAHADVGQAISSVVIDFSISSDYQTSAKIVNPFFISSILR